MKNLRVIIWLLIICSPGSNLFFLTFPTQSVAPLRRKRRRYNSLFIYYHYYYYYNSY